MDYCWPVDTSCCSTFGTYDVAMQERAKALAASTLEMLTGYRMGGCPVTVRPCRVACAPHFNYGYGAFTPVVYGGTWLNITCGCNQSVCGCGPICEIELPPPIGSVTAVSVDGVIVDQAAYRVDDGRFLVRTDGDCWPVCQDLSKNEGEDTFFVTYTKGLPVNELGAWVAGLLACEYAKACSGGKCRLPSGVTEITRQGLSMTIASGAFPNGLTGIREVDAFIQSVNPYALRSRPTVWTPTTPKARITTWEPPTTPPPLLTYSATLEDPPYSDPGWTQVLAQTGLIVEQVTPTPGVATDAEIASIDFGDGTPVLTAPYDRKANQAIKHTFAVVGEYTYTVTYTDPTATASTGLVKVHHSYSLDEKPRDGDVEAGVEPYQVAPWDAYDSPPVLPPNDHFATIDWKDGTTESNPFTVDAEGYVPHVYATAGTYQPSITTFSGYPLGGYINVVPGPPPPPTYAVTEVNEYPVVDFADSAGLKIDQVTPTPGQATDAEIASITWEPGVVQSPPFVRDVLGRILHTYTSFGPKDWRVDFTNGATPVTGTIHATYYYYVGWLPANAIIVAGGTMAMRPLDNWQGNPLPPDQHFAAIDWADGSPIQHPPFTVDGNGYATHVYATAGTYDIQIGFIDNSITSLGITVTATQEDLEALGDQPPPVQGKPPPEGVE